jgi:hypothetical protein
MNEGQICFVCRVKHVDARALSKESCVESPITVHDGRWAYCAAGGHTDHLWEAIDPVSLLELKLAEVAHRRL